MTIMKMIILSQVGLVLDSLDDIHCLTEAKQKEEVGRIERANYKDDDDDDEPSLMMVVSGGDDAMHGGKISRKQSKKRRWGIIIFSWILLW